MKRTLLAVCMILNSPIVFGCMFYSMAPEYNELIKINKLPGWNSYEVIIPQKVNELEYGFEVSVVYSRENSKYPYMGRSGYPRKLRLTKEGLYASAIFEVARKEGYKPFIEVSWFPKYAGMCGVIARSEFLMIE